MIQYFCNYRRNIMNTFTNTVGTKYMNALQTGLDKAEHKYSRYQKRAVIGKVVNIALKTGNKSILSFKNRLNKVSALENKLRQKKIKVRQKINHSADLCLNKLFNTNMSYDIQPIRYPELDR